MPTVRLIPCLALLLAAAPVHAQAIGQRYQETAVRIIEAAVADSAAWGRIAELTDRFGPRLSGSESLERAIDWIMDQMRRDSLENVRGEPVMVPRWVRGEESAELVSPRRARLAMLGLGGSVGTPRGGITAEVMVVGSREELRRRAPEARGRIVLFDVPFTSYGATVQYRLNAAAWAAEVGAVAALIRSVASYSIRSPHTGAMRYDSGVTRQIPAAALSVEDAAMLHRMADRGERVVIRLVMGARTLPEVPSRNVIGELVGRELPEEVVVMGGHIDSWDVGTGAMDDAGGVVAAWEALRLLRRLGLRPRRTIRVVGWTNEENGLRGATAYRDRYAAALDNHVLAIESDGGVFSPTGFGFSGSDSAFAIVTEIGSLLERIGAGRITRGGGGADIGPIMARGVPGMGLSVDGSRYFWFHHSEGDTVDKLDPAEVARCVAALAVMAWVVAELPERLPRAAPGAQDR
ncbi:MAG TPA: M20/M25/M40 family metallo-hydrolase [Gemmatimonadales bacterium]|nr:M20/M25/M40 family metallo-hydrolase [Gemmatimonadales bacterium]